MPIINTGSDNGSPPPASSRRSAAPSPSKQIQRLGVVVIDLSPFEFIAHEQVVERPFWLLEVCERFAQGKSQGDLLFFAEGVDFLSQGLQGAHRRIGSGQGFA